MGKRVFMFPGQGSQYIGMGKEFYDNFPTAKEVFDKASEITGLDVASLCFEENEKIKIFSKRCSKMLQPGKERFSRRQVGPV